MRQPIAERVADLTTRRVPFVRATVVRAQEPTSARPGDDAIVLADGTVEGFVGGQCAVGSVRTAALEALESGDSLLLRVLPAQDAAFPNAPGASVVVNPCLSGGALEIFLQPVLPPWVLHLVGASPTAEALADLAGRLGFAVQRDGDGVDLGEAVAVLVATHGGEETKTVRRARDAGVGFVGVVCSRRRGEALLAELALTDAERARVHPHVGLAIGARTAPEVALSILAEIVLAVRVDGLTAPAGPDRSPRPVTVVDPVCQMTVTVTPDAPHAVVGGVDYWFCGPGCRDSFLKAHPT